MMENILSKLAARLRVLGPDPAGKALIVLAGLLLAAMAVQGVRYGLTGKREKKILESLQQGNEGPPKRTGVKELSEFDSITKKGILGTVKAAKKPPQKLWGIMGSEALFGASEKDAKAYAVGAKLPSGEKIARVESDHAVVEKDGKERTVYVFDASKKPTTDKAKGEPPTGGTPGKTGKPADDKPVPPPEVKPAPPPEVKTGPPVEPIRDVS